ncbi:MAG: response regulator [Bacteroidales bacterium]|nr:response regulator [Bacteroidales bacterium]
MCSRYTILTYVAILVAITSLIGCSSDNDTDIELPIIDKECYQQASNISNQKVTAIAEDTLGQIWVGTFRGLNRLDSRDIFQYYSSTTDTLTICDNQITDVICDSKGKMWVATVDGVSYHTEQDNFRRIKVSNKLIARQLVETRNGKILANQYSCISEYKPALNVFEPVIENCGDLAGVSRAYVDDSNLLWVVNSKSVLCYDIETYKQLDAIELGAVYSSYMTQNGIIWIGTDKGLKIVDTRQRSFSSIPMAIANHASLQSIPIMSICEERNGNVILINAADQAFYFTPSNGGKVYAYGEKEFPIDVPLANISKLLIDTQQNIWLGSLDQGLSVIYKDRRRFNRDHHLRQKMQGKSVIALTTDKEDNLWITTLYDGVWVRLHDSHEVIQTNIEDLLAKIPNRTKPNKIQLAASNWSTGIHYIFVDRDNYLWMAGVDRLYKVKHTGKGVVKIEESFDVRVPMCINQDEQGTIWVGTSSPYVYAKRESEDKFTVVQLDVSAYTFTTGMEVMKDGSMLVVSFSNKIQIITLQNRQTGVLNVADADYKRCIPRSSFIPTATYIDGNGDIWIGTICNGLLHYDIQRMCLEPIPGAPCNDISGIEQDIYGNLWVSTQNGLGCYDIRNKRFTTFSMADGTDGNQYYDRASCKLKDGTLVFGGTHGLTFFNPMDIQTNRKSAIIFQNLMVNNQMVRPQDNGILEKALCLTQELSLKHDQNNINIGFSLLDFCPNPRVRYRYKMEGYDKQWTESGHNHSATYNNLPPGEYTFKVEATSGNDNYVVASKCVKIDIISAPWLSWWAMLAYFLIAIILISYIVIARTRVIKSRENMKRALLDKDHEQKINHMNMSFFANVSHEFRTPLTMISGPLAQIQQSKDLSQQNSQLLQIISRNVDRMLRLVNQLMDFGKLDNDMLRLEVSAVDISSQLNHIVEIFKINAMEKNISFRTYGIEEELIAWIDVDKLEKIVNNLLGNAIKFTPQGGTIQLGVDILSEMQADKVLPKSELKRAAHYICLQVVDSGVGLPEDSIEQIFDRYYQVSNNSVAHASLGTGIGLYYARGLARLHHGWLYAENRKDKQGSVFTCILPMSRDVYSSEEIVDAEEKQHKKFPIVKEDVTPVAGARSETTIMVVDDDTEVAHYLKTLLSPQYNVICKFDVDSALTAINDQLPDIVLSDVVMPNKDGYELCRTIKEDVQICHVPVILVTARGAIENQVEGLKIGADAYVPKPFDPSYLMALIQSLLKNRERQRQVLSNATQTDTIEEDVLTPQDSAFMSNLYNLMEAELSDSELDVTRMAEKLNMSRTKFYYKVKALTGEAPGVFFKTYKLNRAAELLKEGQYNVSEVAVKTGFGTLSHFSTSFKKRFGVAPTGYR